MTAVHQDAALHKMLERSPVLRLTLIDQDYGAPCPEDRWQVKAAIDALLTPASQGMVLDVDILEHDDGGCDDVLVIGVVDLDTGVAALRELLKELNVAEGATLVLDGSTENLLTGLSARDVLLRSKTEDMIQNVLAECIQCAPPDWKAGTLTIECDGNWLGYQLKNPNSEHTATISDRLRHLCEEFAVLMWKNGNTWTEAVLRYEGQQFNVAFNYDGRKPDIPPPAAAPKPWWKIW